MASVLIIEDSHYQRKTLSTIARAEGYEILESGSGMEGLKIALEKKPDCILLDMLLPDIDGLNFLKILQARTITVPTIIVTADIQESTCTACLELGAFAVTHKPPKPETIKNLLRQALAAGGRAGS